MAKSVATQDENSILIASILYTYILENNLYSSYM